MGLFRRKKEKIHLVVGINQVDNLGEWNEVTNQPTEDTEKEIKSRTHDIIRKLSSGEFSISEEQIEYYSAIRAFRLHHLNAKITKFCKEGVVMQNSPKEFYEVADKMPAKLKEIAQREREKDIKEFEEKYSIDALIAKMAAFLSKEEINTLKELWEDTQARPVRVGILGKCGVGKSTTVNNLFQGELEEIEPIEVNTSRTFVGNHKAQYKKYRLPKGGQLTIVDLPGYGRTIEEDKSYRDIYLQELKNCDIIILIIQANSSDLVDDQIMIKTLIEWKRANLI